MYPTLRQVLGGQLKAKHSSLTAGAHPPMRESDFYVSAQYTIYMYIKSCEGQEDRVSEFWEVLGKDLF